MDISARAYALTITKTADTLGVPMPASYLEHVDRAETLAAAVSEITSTRSDDLTVAAISAVEAGRDYRTDETVQGLMLDRVLATQGIEHIARSRANEQLWLTLAELADDILETWAEALDPHAAALAAAAEAGLTLENPADVIAKGGNNMELMHKAQTAVTAWMHAVRGFNAFAALTHTSHGPQEAPLILTPARRAQLLPAYDLARTERSELDAWPLVRCGIPLELATLDEFKARAATFEADRQAEARAEVEARQQRVASSW